MMIRPQEIEASWYGQAQLGGCLKHMLRLAAKVYGVAIMLRAALYRWRIFQSTRLPVPVIVVGNLIVGGAGKTPVARALAQQLKAMGWHPGIISRGYGRQVPGVRPVQVGDDSRCVGDEPLLYAQDGVPVFVGEKRVAAGSALLAAHPEVDILIADDGLQHLALARDLEIVVFDQRGVGNGALLPAGPLREPVSRLTHASVRGLVIQGNPPPFKAPEHLPRYAMTLVPDVLYSINKPTNRLPLQDFRGQTVLALAGIGHPERFFSMLREQGLMVQGYAFPDHYNYTLADMPETDLPILMTEKDAVKCRQFAKGHDNWFVVPVSAVFSPSIPLADWLGGSAPLIESR